jgi:hypothetical protein
MSPSRRKVGSLPTLVMVAMKGSADADKSDRSVENRSWINDDSNRRGRRVVDRTRRWRRRGRRSIKLISSVIPDDIGPGVRCRRSQA